VKRHVVHGPQRAEVDRQFTDLDRVAHDH
jgi:hypothetical protein